MSHEQPRSGVRVPRSVRLLIASPVVILFASATRLLLISNYDSSTATELAASGGVVGTLLGTVVPLLAPYLPLLCILLAIVRKWVLLSLSMAATALLSPAHAKPEAGWKSSYAVLRWFWETVRHFEWESLWTTEFKWAAGCAVAGAAISIFVAPEALLFENVLWSVDSTEGKVLGLILFVVLRFAYAAVVASICAVVVPFVNTVYTVPFDGHVASEIARRPWLPPERITLRSGTVHAGYVLSTENDWFVVLREYDRTIEYIPADDVIIRAVCTFKEGQPTIDSPLIKLYDVRQPRVPYCYNR
jgi:hypothetical protein